MRKLALCTVKLQGDYVDENEESASAILEKSALSEVAKLAGD